MDSIDIRLNMDANPWSDLDKANTKTGNLERMGIIDLATEEGRPAVALLIRLPDGTVVVANIAWRLFKGAYTALNACPIVREDARRP